ncbi:SH3 domain-containing protein [Amycolatopsis sp. CA-230715]|uniref:SH3 domain-containing protein n=1 Tax=Amycolatopsis sp. CA-230715 TaxID=2745196 RepID=UPI001C03414B|nr:SH3 domain-containing protein [Amycolatopsis sp. CA-230715]QWF79470.1 hypothetical protein HUW46_02878 [Amycolatopsis sp. CA-230715]
MILGIPKRMLIIGAVLIGIGLIYVVGQGKQFSSGASSGCRVTVTADVLNVRGAPLATAELVGKYNQNAEIDAQPEVQNGFRKLADNKWASTQFLKPVDEAKCTVPPPAPPSPAG